MGCDHTLTVKYMAITIHTYTVMVTIPTHNPFPFFFLELLSVWTCQQWSCLKPESAYGAEGNKNLLAGSSTKEISNLMPAVASSVGLEISISTWIRGALQAVACAKCFPFPYTHDIPYPLKPQVCLSNHQEDCAHFWGSHSMFWGLGLFWTKFIVAWCPIDGKSCIHSSNPSCSHFFLCRPCVFSEVLAYSLVS